MKAILLDCGKIERLAEDIYRQMARQSEFSEKVRATFTQMAEDEREHAAQLDLALQFPEESLGMVKRISWEKVAEGLDLINKIYQDIDHYLASEEAALKMAIELENKFVRMHLDNAIHFRVPRIAGLFQQLSCEDESHLETLRACLSWWHSNRRKEN
jgi:rubrerythrin